MTATLSRRATLLTALGALSAPALVTRAAAMAPATLPPALAPYRRLGLGQFNVTTLLAGTRTLEKPQETFGLNATPKDFADLSKAAFIPADRGRNFFTPTLLDTGSKVILFDTGLAPEGTVAALEAAGYTPDQVDLVVISHMHGDHIGGLSANGTLTFPNADYAVGLAEFNHWAARGGNEAFETKVRPLVERMRFMVDGESVVSGVTALRAPGHTVGHMVFMLESEGHGLMLTIDTANHFVWSLQRPDWEVRFDDDKQMAAATRRKVFGQIAADRIPFIGYHMPFPGVGYLEPAGDGFRFVAASYQLDL